MHVLTSSPFIIATKIFTTFVNWLYVNAWNKLQEDVSDN